MGPIGPYRWIGTYMPVNPGRIGCIGAIGYIRGVIGYIPGIGIIGFIPGIIEAGPAGRW